MGELLAPAHLLILIVVGAFFLVPFWRIFKKAGFPPALSLLMLVPLLNIFALYFLAFASWPLHRKSS